MTRSVFLARLIGPLFIAIGLGMLVNREIYQAMIDEFVRSTVLVDLSGCLSLLGGLAIVNTHPSWTRDWRVIITVLGWLMSIGGVVRIILPRVAVMLGTTIYATQAAVIFVAIVAIALGGFLSFRGYWAEDESVAREAA